MLQHDDPNVVMPPPGYRMFPLQGDCHADLFFPYTVDALERFLNINHSVIIDRVQWYHLLLRPPSRDRTWMIQPHLHLDLTIDKILIKIKKIDFFDFFAVI